ncbi:MAG: CHAT domain-containing protein, partial [Bacteroidota bacterium]
NLATCLRFVGQLDSAALMVRQTIPIYEQLAHPDTINWLRSLNELADIALELEDLQLANSSMLSAQSLLSAKGNILPVDAFNSHYLGARIALNFQDYPSAIIFAERAIGVAEAADENGWLADALTALAGAQKRDDKLLAARRSFRRAADILEGREQEGAEVPGLPLVYLNLAIIEATEDKDYTKALAYCDAAAQRLPQTNLELQLEVALRRGAILAEAERTEASLVTLNGGIRQLRGAAHNGELPRPLPDSLRTVDYTIAARLLEERARLLKKMNRKSEALQDYETYFAILELLRSRVNSDASRRYLSENLRLSFDEAINLYLSDQRGTEAARWRAFELSERAKAYSLLTALQNNRNTMPKREAELRGRIAELERKNTPQSQPLLEAARLQLDRLLEAGKQAIETALPPFDRSDLLALIKREQTHLLAYHLGEKQGFVFYVSPGGELEVTSIDDPTKLAEKVEAWREALTASAYRRKSLRPQAAQNTLDSTFMAQGRELTKLLLPDGAPQARLCILPDAALNFLPFAVLPLADAPLPLDYRAVAYLQNNRELTYAYSAQFLLELDRLPTVDYQYNLIAFAPAFGGATDLSANRSLDVERLRALPGLRPLRYNQEEVSEIENLMAATQTYLGPKADRGNFLKHLGQGRIVHLSSHGMVNGGNPYLSFIALSQLGDSLELEELLYFNDLSALTMTSELAVLSACETNLGEYVRGESALSLASAFAAAGARSTLTSLWQVDDAATKELMVNFYQELTTGQRRGAALAAAQEQHRLSQEYAHPYYWSAFTLYGAAGTIGFSEGNSLVEGQFFFYILAALAFLAVLLWWRKRSDSNKNTV